MDIVETPLPGTLILKPRRHADARRRFVEIWSRRVLLGAGVGAVFVQDNLSLSRRAGVVRGLHFQVPPNAQAKLLRVGRGAIFDVAVDLRRGSPTYGRHFTLTLRADDFLELYLPPGLAHGFCALEPDTEVLHKVDAYHSPADERGILWNGPALGIAWPVEARDAILSEKDRANPPLAAHPDYFASAQPCAAEAAE